MSDVQDSAADPTVTPVPASTTSDDEPVAESNHVQENSTPEPNVESQPTMTIAITETDPSSSSSSSAQRAFKPYATTAEAIANFRPSSREVVEGIAPHVFDERKRRRSHPRSRSRSPKPYWYAAASGEKRSSPLRGATVISWDEHSIYLGESFQFLVAIGETPWSSLCFLLRRTSYYLFQTRSVC